jgi:hypothetical protein
VTEVVAVLKKAGKAELAARYQMAIDRATAAIEHHRQLIEQDAPMSP